MSAAQPVVQASKPRVPLVVTLGQAVVTFLRFDPASPGAFPCRVKQLLVVLQPGHRQETDLLSTECGSDAG
jgi:hypothetical protein